MMTRLLLRLMGLVFMVAVVAGVAVLLGRDRSSGTGMALIFFLPLSALAVLAGGGATMIRFTRHEALTGFERRFGFGLAVAVVGVLIALAVLLATE